MGQPDLPYSTAPFLFLRDMANSQVAFITIPSSGNEYVKAKGIAQKSTKTIFAFADQLIAKDFTGKCLLITSTLSSCFL